MKTTVDLPDALVNVIKVRTAQEGREVTAVIADMLAAGISPAATTRLEDGRPVSKTLPLIKVRPAQPPDVHKLTTQEWCDWIKDLDLQLEVERYEKALGHQHVDL